MTQDKKSARANVEFKRAQEQKLPKTASYYRSAVKMARALGIDISYDVDLRHATSTDYFPAQLKRELSKVREDYEYLFARPHKILKIRNKEKLKAAQEYGGHKPSKSNDKLKVAVITSGYPDQKLTLDFAQNEEGKTYVRSVYENKRKVRSFNIIIDKVRLVNEGAEYLWELVGFAGPNDYFSIVTGSMHVMPGGNAQRIVNLISKLMNKYSDPSANNFYGNWLNNLSYIKVTRGESYENVKQAYKKAAESSRKTNRKRYNKDRVKVLAAKRSARYRKNKRGY